MRDRYPSLEGLLREETPRAPVYCVYPHVYRKTAQRFVKGFPGRVLYAVKANDHPLVIRALNEGGVTHFDCASVQEIARIRSIISGATCYLMNPVRYEGDAQRAQQEFGTRHFMIDHLSGLAPLVAEIDVASSVVFARMAVSHHSAMADLSTKFGAPPADIPAILRAIHESGAEAALAFNVGTGVREHEAYVRSLDLAGEILAALPFPVRLLDIGGGFPHSYPGYEAPPLAEYFAAIRGLSDSLPLAAGGELLAEPGRGLAAPGLSALTRVLLRKEDRLYLNDGMYGAFWELRFKGHLRFPACAYRGSTPLSGEPGSFRLFGPTCDSSDEMPGAVELPAGIDVGDYIEFGSIGAYSVSGRTDFNGFGSDGIVTIEDDAQLPPA
jgi:ornithine decarboxylase